MNIGPSSPYQWTPENLVEEDVPAAAMISYRAVLVRGDAARAGVFTVSKQVNGKCKLSVRWNCEQQHTL